MCLILSVILMCCLFGCSSGGEDEDDKLISNVKEMEKNEYKLLAFQITYDKYKKATEKMLDKEFINKDDHIIFGYESKMYRGKDLVGVTQEEMTEMKKRVEEATGISIDKLKADTVEISQVYNDDNFKLKHVFVKETKKLEDDLQLYNYRKYWFKKIESTWKIIDISDYGTTSDFPKEERDEFEKFNGENIKYINKLDLMK